MAETYVGAVLEAVLSKVIPITTEHIDLAWGLQDELTRLGDSLEMIKAFLQDAEEGRTKNNLVKLWLQRLKVVAYKADDVLDEFSYEILRRKVEIQDHIGRKSAMDHESHVFGRSNVETISFMDDSNIVGRKSDVSKVVDLLVNPKDDQVVSFVPIVGPGGLGKTTSAKLVYKDVSVERHFDVKTWVCFSNDFDVKRILKEMLDHFPNQRTLISDSMNAIVQKHKEKMEEAKGEKEQIKYLLVLDDVWSVEKCKELKLCLIGICKNGGSGVIVTTRSQGVASAVQAFPSQWHQAGKLEDDECWSIIKERAPRGSPMPRELEFIGREIAKQCQAVPLVAKVIAGTMCNIEKSQDAWMKIETSDVWGSGESVLKLNFDRLSSPSLKKCFAYCAMFPRDYCFEKDQLIQLWMAEGFLGNSMAMVDIASLGELKHLRYFDISKTFIRALPGSIAKLYNLQTLRLMERGHWIEELGCINQLHGELRICNLQHVRHKQEANGANLHRKEKLCEVILEWRWTVRDCNSEQVLEDELSSLAELKLIEIGEGLSRLLPNSLLSNTCLCNLTISDLLDLVSVPEALVAFNCLRKLTVGGFSGELQELPNLNSIQHLSHSLQVLHLIGRRKLKSVPHQLQLLTGLEELTIDKFEGMEALPEWLGNIYSLKLMQLISCHNIMYLPSVDVMRSIPNLERFCTIRCPKLETKCAKGSGPERSKICRIPETNITGEELVQPPLVTYSR
ncbi:Detected protein of unknown function [Hibiscus syriacus]|uniref:Disease resistance protein RGA3 n=1 Tax=Hibiscus syriacus TaxID=106335 RepID=A0A6A2YNF1_HIBSY|nr:Detected protein of unknown function [Hibiscus syriacus]